MRVLFGSLFLALASALAAGPVPVIFDTDMAGDVDDALALAMIHSLASRGECRLLGVTISTDMPAAAPYIDAVNRFYGRPGIPIGTAAPGVKPGHDQGYTTAVVASGLYPVAKPLPTEPAVALLRRLLRESPEPVTIIHVGFAINLAALLDSAEDRALVAQKVRLVSIMAGEFTRPRPEYNVVQHLASARRLIADWPGELLFSGFEIGLALPYPAAGIEQDFAWTAHHPVADAYRHYKKMPYDRPTWDPTSVLVAVRPGRQYFDLSPAGRVTVDEKGVTTFAKAEGGRHRYLILADVQRGRALEAMRELVSQPR